MEVFHFTGVPLTGSSGDAGLWDQGQHPVVEQRFYFSLVVGFRRQSCAPSPLGSPYLLHSAPEDSFVEPRRLCTRSDKACTDWWREEGNHRTQKQA